MSLPNQNVKDKAAEMKISWKKAYGESGQPEPSDAKLLAMAEESLAAESAAEKGMLALEAELAADDARAAEYWFLPENIAAREAKAAAKKAAEEGR